MEKAELMLQILPALHEGPLVAVGPVGDRDPYREPSRFEKTEEAADVTAGASGRQEEGRGEVVDRIGGHEDRSAAVMDLVDAKNAGEVLQHPLPMGGAVYLRVRPLKAVVDESDRDLKEEVLAEMALNLVDREMIPDQQVDDLLSHRVGVAAPQRDAFDRRGEELGADTGGGIDPDHEPP